MRFIADKDKFGLPGKRSMTCAMIGFPSIGIIGFGKSYPARLNRSPKPDIGITICILRRDDQLLTL